MESSGTVQSDAKALSTLGTNYTSQVDGISSWEGDSYKSLCTQSKDVVSSFVNVVIEQMNSLAAGCAACNNYSEYKKAYDTALGNYNKAIAAKDEKAAAAFSVK